MNEATTTLTRAAGNTQKEYRLLSNFISCHQTKAQACSRNDRDTFSLQAISLNKLGVALGIIDFNDVVVISEGVSLEIKVP